MKRIATGDKLVDWFFKNVIRALNEGIEEIYIQDRVMDRGDDLCGLLKDDRIYLSSSRNKNPNDSAKVLLHEVIHFLFDDLTEDDVLFLEDELWARLSKQQKEILKFYITNLAKNRSAIPQQSGLTSS